MFPLAKFKFVAALTRRSRSAATPDDNHEQQERQNRHDYNAPSAPVPFRPGDGHGRLRPEDGNSPDTR
jgi:hypothetical protein